MLEVALLIGFPVIPIVGLIRFLFLSRIAPNLITAREISERNLGSCRVVCKLSSRLLPLFDVIVFKSNKQRIVLTGNLSPSDHSSKQKYERSIFGSIGVGTSFGIIEAYGMSLDN